MELFLASTTILAFAALSTVLYHDFRERHLAEQRFWDQARNRPGFYDWAADDEAGL